MSRILLGRLLESRRGSQVLLLAGCFAVVGGMALAAQDRFSVVAPNGVAFSEFRGYETWQTVSVSQVDDGIKVILGNAKMIDAYRSGVPSDGKTFPDGAAVVKIEWSMKKNPESPYTVTIPDTLKSVSFIEKDSKRFPETSGWGYAQFLYNASSQTFTPFGADGNFGKVCYGCHTAVKAKDYIFTAYSPR
jgi:hypothetical protein